MFLHVVLAVIVAVILGYLFQDINEENDTTAGTQDRFGIMYFLVTYLALMALSSLPLWHEDKVCVTAVAAPAGRANCCCIDHHWLSPRC